MARQKLEGRFGYWIKEGFFLYKNNFIVLMVATLLAWALSMSVVGLFAAPMLTGVVLARGSVMFQSMMASALCCISSISFAILGGPLFAGLALLTLGLLDRKRPAPGIGDVFKGFQYYLDSFLFVAAWSVIGVMLNVLAPFVVSPILLPVMPVVFAIAIGTLSMFGLFLIVDNQRSFIQAFRESFKMAVKHLWLYAAIVLFSGAVSSVGLVACGIGVIVTAPMYFCILAVVYRDTMKADR